MEWLESIFLIPSDLQAGIVISLTCALGLMLGKLRFCGISLGVAFVFFMGILGGATGIKLHPQMATYAESFGLVLSMYALGLQVGPGFVSSFRKGGTTLNLWALAVIFLGTGMMLLLLSITQVGLPAMTGILCGATTNTPALGAAQQMLKQIGADGSPALGCAVTYPLGILGVILAMLVLRVLFRKKIDARAETDDEGDDSPCIVSFDVCNPAIFHHSLHEIAGLNEKKFVVSRLWRGDEVILPDANTLLEEGDRILVVAPHKYVDSLTVFFGRLDRTDWDKNTTDWNAIDQQLVSQRVVITRPEINGKKVGALQLRNRFGINVSRVHRSGLEIVATPGLVLQMGDRLTVVGEKEAVEKVAKELGNTVKDLDEPNLVAIFVGIVLGMILGAVPFSLPGISLPVKLGIAGGPMVIGLLIGAYGPRLHMVTYTTSSANRMLRSLGLSMYLACLGLDAGSSFFATVVRPEGLLWIGLGFVLTVLPALLVGFLCLKAGKLDFSTVSGMLCGSMANPMALNYINTIGKADKAMVAYTTVYPLSMFVRVIAIQLLVLGLL